MITTVVINGRRHLVQLQDWVEHLLESRRGRVCFHRLPSGEMAVVDEAMPGCSLIQFDHPMSADEMAQLAEALNQSHGISAERAAAIVSASMQVRVPGAGLDLASMPAAGRA